MNSVCFHEIYSGYFVVHSLFNPVHIFIGEGTLSKLPSLIKNQKYVVVSSRGLKSRGWNNYFSNNEYTIDTVSPNPTISELVAHIETLGKIKFDILVAIGGGSVLDTAKALSVLSDSSEESVIDHLEGNKDCTTKQYDLISTKKICFSLTIKLGLITLGKT